MHSFCLYFCLSFKYFTLLASFSVYLSNFPSHYTPLYQEHVSHHIYCTYRNCSERVSTFISYIKGHSSKIPSTWNFDNPWNALPAIGCLHPPCSPSAGTWGPSGWSWWTGIRRTPATNMLLSNSTVQTVYTLGSPQILLKLRSSRVPSAGDLGLTNKGLPHSI